MQFAVGVAALISVALCAPPQKVIDKFNQFAKEKGLDCAGGACSKKLANYERRLARLEELQNKSKRLGKAYELGETKFMTWSDEEMKGILNQQPIEEPKVPKMKEERVKRQSAYWQQQWAAQAATVDWRLKASKPVSPVRDQGQCGSCWSFATVAAVEAQWNSLGHASNFSEQQLVDCDTTSFGCNGGYTSKALTYMHNVGNALQTAYPYTSGTTKVAGTCQSAVAKTAVVNTTVWASTVTAMENAVRNYGPLVIQIYVPEEFFYYTTGVFNPNQTLCSSTNNQGGHAMALVGYGTDSTTGTPYWIIRNSWGPNWGEGGYIRMKKGINNCIIESYAYLPLVYGQKAVAI